MLGGGDVILDNNHRRNGMKRLWDVRGGLIMVAGIIALLVVIGCDEKGAREAGDDTVEVTREVFGE